MDLPVHRFMFSAPLLLRHFLEKGFPRLSDIVHTLFLAERAVDPQIPDHRLKGRRQIELCHVKCAHEAVIHSIETLAAQYLEFKYPKVYSNFDNLESWQVLITRINPLPLLAYCLWDNYRRPLDDFREEIRFIEEILVPNVGRSTLPAPRCPAIDHLVSTRGLTELHMHLNGTTEADWVWLDALENPTKIIQELDRSLRHEFPYVRAVLREQYDQIEPGLTPGKLLRRLFLARDLRSALIDYAVYNSTNGMDIIVNTERIRIESRVWIGLGKNRIITRHLHQFAGRLNVKKDQLTTIEAWWQARLFHRLETAEPKAKSEALGIFHAYWLIASQFNRFLVHQHDQSGFDQFQKITYNEFRSVSERDYCRRFRQLARNGIRSELHHIEGRFAPSPLKDKTPLLLKKICKGFDRAFENHPPDSKPKLSLTAHFIKVISPVTESPAVSCRHSKLRRTLMTSTSTLVLCRKLRLYRELITSADAASNELHAPPEVFAPAFRRLRHNGIVSFTFHVGEDFRHLLSGIRAVYEAINYLDLAAGDRLGHAIAVGVDANLWLSRTGNQVPVEKGEWLDNLVFAREMLKRTSLLGEASVLDDDISRLSTYIYGICYSPEILLRAWKLRKLDASMVTDHSPKLVSGFTLWRRRESNYIHHAYNTDPQAFEILAKYHSSIVDKRSREYILVETGALQVDRLGDSHRYCSVSPEGLCKIQELVVRELHCRQILVECPLTSNVRIGIYRDFSEHHIFRWMEMKDGPPVALCTDDPGIFATCLRIEFAHAYRELRKRGYSSHEAAEKLERLETEAQRHAFKMESQENSVSHDKKRKQSSVHSNSFGQGTPELRRW